MAAQNIAMAAKVAERATKNTTMAAKRDAMAAKLNLESNQGIDCVIAKTVHVVHPNRRFIGPKWVNPTTT